MILERLKWWIAGDELLSLHRYRVACAEVCRWNGRIPVSCDTAAWIMQFGEGERGNDIQEFRKRLEAPTNAPPEVSVSEELKPCPFCGSDAETDRGGFGEIFAACTKCWCHMGGAWSTTETAAIAAWNRRPGDPPMIGPALEFPDLLVGGCDAD